MDYDEIESIDNYNDTEETLDSKDYAKLINNLADHYMAHSQEVNKGKLLAHYKSVGLFNTYLDIYERAIVGRMKIFRKKTTDIVFGYANIAGIEVKGSTIYFIMKYDEIYYIRHMKIAEWIVYQINKQKVNAMRNCIVNEKDSSDNRL